MDGETEAGAFLSKFALGLRLPDTHCESWEFRLEAPQNQLGGSLGDPVSPGSQGRGSDTGGSLGHLRAWVLPCSSFLYWLARLGEWGQTTGPQTLIR